MAINVVMQMNISPKTYSKSKLQIQLLHNSVYIESSIPDTDTIFKIQYTFLNNIYTIHIY